MKKNLTKTFLFIILLLLAVVLGKITGAACAGIPYAAWLGTGAKFGFSPFSVNLSVVSFTIGATVDINVAQAVFLLAAIIAYPKIKV
ncbi:MAG: DUF4321 domain-containing protein [Clostridiales bacterium]|jgi:hypothetical protein|nr:DUF4321 domain-containing protein [Clostridiales bacterium]